MTKRTNRSCTAEFKQEAVALVTDQGYSVPKAAASLGTNEKYFVSGFNFDVPGVNSLHIKTNTPRLVTGKVRFYF